MNKCLYCYAPLEDGVDYHTKCSLQFFGTVEAPHINYTLAEMDALAQQVIERSISVPGVQAKLSMSVVRELLQGQHPANQRLAVVGALGGNYILKPPSSHYPELPANEHLTMRIAAALKIPVVPASLVRLKSGELAYLTRRVDRKATGEKLHMLDMFQILEASKKYMGSMEKIGKALGAYSTQPLLDKLRLFELTLFSFLTGNNDMHLKNFSMLLDENGWTLAPAYDLLNVTIVLPADEEELALTLAGKKSKFKRAHFEDFGRGLGLNDKQIAGAFRRMWAGKDKALDWIERSFLHPETKACYSALLDERYARLYPSAAAQ
jgi:serine/threonine-protein kinase HipA